MARAKGMALLGEKVSAEQAEAWGLIWRCVDDDRLMDETLALARHFATQPTRGLALIKQALHASADNTFEQQLNLERDLQREAGRTEDYRGRRGRLHGKTHTVIQGEMSHAGTGKQHPDRRHRRGRHGLRHRQVAAQAGHPVFLHDQREGAAEAGRAGIAVSCSAGSTRAR